MEKLTVHRGDGRQITVTLTLSGDAWNVPGGATVRCTGKNRKSDADADAVFTYTTGSGISVTDNVATITIDPDDTDDIVATTALHCDVQVTPTSGIPVTVAEFLLVIEPDVSRTTP